MQRSNDQLKSQRPALGIGLLAISYIINSSKSHGMLTTDRSVGHRRNAEGHFNFEMKSRC
jgi:hypothetical protein